ncbi:hypothetical protein Taro_015430 [Colocasia esculenta]|uniref:Uncharacterized protein n=1 Tax=Colocasia esculenta TaxID=4460 RepID=A0A843UL92_COLES|nr:hypothetical protein [Colocasia esculenta]
MEEVFEEEHPLHAWVNATTSVEPEFDPHDRAWVEGELDDVSLLPEFETPPTPKRQKKALGARVRSKQRDISIADLETIEEDNDDETPEPRQGQGQDQQASEDSGYNPNFIPHRRNWLMKKKKMQEEWERQEKLRMELETMEQVLDTLSYASIERYYQGQGGYLAYP